MTSTSNFSESSDIPDSPEMPHSRKIIYSVAELTRRIKQLIEGNFPFVWIRGEISNFRMPSSGHCYFTLKDESAQIAAVVFRAQNRQLKFDLEDGLSVIGLGRLSIYEPRGTYQIILEHIEPAGLGALQLAFEKLKRRLADEGYFDEAHKKPIPFLPCKISLITSPSGAVVHDIITIISRRFPNVHLGIVPVKVQGAGSEDEIAAALRIVNARADSDVIILARGGGSLEDLQAFNSEKVAMAIFASRIPVISAVGHETDVTIADFIADLRAPTPSAAAELVVPEKNELIRYQRDLEHALRTQCKHQLQKLNQSINELMRRLIDPRRKVQELWLRIDDLYQRLGRLMTIGLRHNKDRLKEIAHRLSSSSPIKLSQKINLILKINRTNLLNNIKHLIDSKCSTTTQATIKLESLNPLAILQRGYSVTRSLPERRVVTHPDQVMLEQLVEVLIADGSLVCNVKEKSIHGKKNV
jgi:exodeoxyribonuclease VII large subunit